MLVAGPSKRIEGWRRCSIAISYSTVKHGEEGASGMLAL
ncbi:MAG: hypothetical protein ACI9TF_000276 [Paracrocinitomix sp.]|jgi:hypothetical protein